MSVNLNANDLPIMTILLLIMGNAHFTVSDQRHTHTPMIRQQFSRKRRKYKDDGR